MTDHKFVPANPWTPTKCRHCMLAEKAHPEVESTGQTLTPHETDCGSAER